MINPDNASWYAVSVENGDAKEFAACYNSVDMINMIQEHFWPKKLKSEDGDEFEPLFYCFGPIDEEFIGFVDKFHYNSEDANYWMFSAKEIRQQWK